jgi:hypothetical protein
MEIMRVNPRMGAMPQLWRYRACYLMRNRRALELARAV